MRVVNDKNGNYVRTENVTAPPPASGMFCARDEHGVPVALAARQHEQQLAAERAEAATKKEARRAARDKSVEVAKPGDAPAAATDQPKE